MKACVFLADGFEEIEALCPVDVLRRAGVETIIVSITNNLNVCGSHKIVVGADKLFDEIDFNDVNILILPGGMPGTNNLNQHIGLKNLIIEFYNNNKWIAAICAAPMILGQLGILKNRLATCYPGYEKYLDGATLMQDGVVVSDKIITCKGAGLSLDFAFAITNAVVGNKTAEELKEKMIFQ